MAFHGRLGSILAAAIDQETVLLAHMDGTAGSTTFTDSARGGNAPHTLTANGDAKVINGHLLTANGNAQLDTAQYKFGTSSLLLDGTGDYVTIPDSTDWDLGLSNEAFTIECWVKTSVNNATQVILDRGDTTNDWDTTTGHSYIIQWQYPAEDIYFYYNNNGGSAQVIAAAAASSFADGTWHHVAVVYDGTTCKLYLDGTVGGTTSTDTFFHPSSAATTLIGMNPATSADLWVGHIDELRVSKGIARYTTGFTPSTTAFTTDTYTKLLCHFEGADTATAMYDDSTSSSVVKFSQMLALDGTGDYLSIPDSADWDFGTGDFTIEFWARPVSLPVNDGIIGAAIGIASQTGWVLQGSGDGQKVQLTSNASGSWQLDVKMTNSLTLAVWQHVALARNGNTMKWFVDGVENGSADVTGYTYNDASAGSTIGRAFTDIDNYYFDGHIDEVRISKGVARYTANFTPPTAPFKP